MIGNEKKPELFLPRDRTPSPGQYRAKSIFEKPEIKVTPDGLIIKEIPSYSFRVAERGKNAKVIGPDKQTYAHGDVLNPGPGYYEDEK